MNPFFQLAEDDVDEFVEHGLDNSSHMFAYSSNLSGMFSHLQAHNKVKE